MTAAEVRVAITDVRPSDHRYPWPTAVGIVVDGPEAGTTVVVAVDQRAEGPLRAMLADDDGPVIVAETWQLVAEVIA